VRRNWNTSIVFAEHSWDLVDGVVGHYPLRHRHGRAELDLNADGTLAAPPALDEADRS